MLRTKHGHGAAVLCNSTKGTDVLLGESGLDAGEHGADDARLEASTGGFAYGILRVVCMAVIIVRGHGLERLRRQLSEEDGGSLSWLASFIDSESSGLSEVLRKW